MEYATIIEHWQLDRRYHYVRIGWPVSAPFLAVMDDFDNLVEVEY